MEHWTHRSGVWVESTAGTAIRVIERVAARDDGSRRLLSGASAPLQEGERVIREAWLHVVNPDGSTRFTVPDTALFQTRLARRAAIPAERIKHLTDDQLTKLGYV